MKESGIEYMIFLDQIFKGKQLAQQILEISIMKLPYCDFKYRDDKEYRFF